MRDSKIREFAHRLAKCESRAELYRKQLQLGGPSTDILFWIGEAHIRSDQDEALWRCFLAGHFGRASADSKDAICSAAKILCAFGKRPFWDWKRVSSNSDSMRRWLIEHCVELRSLRFGNHRKYESHKPAKLYEVVFSFVIWVKQNGGSPKSAFGMNTRATPDENFDTLYHSVKNISHFG